MDLAHLLEHGPPKDLDVERKLLSAVLVSDDDATPDENLASLRIVFERIEAADFGDAFHAWLFGVIGEARTVHGTLARQLAFILAPANKRIARGRFGVDNLADEIASLLVRRDGSSCAGYVASLRQYANYLRRVRQHREHIMVAWSELQRGYDEWEQQRSGDLLIPD